MQDNEWTTFGLASMEEPIDKPQTSQGHKKISAEGGSSQILVGLESLKMTEKGNGIIINQDGTIISGNMHLARDISKIRVNGFWVFNDELLTTLPSSIYTPIPVLKYKEPAFTTIVSRLTSGLTVV